MDPLISTEALSARLGDPATRPVDASWYLPATGRDARAEYEAAHIPGAGFVDLDEASDPASPLPHTAPAPDRLAEALRRAGIGPGVVPVFYDGHDGGVFSAARPWWLARASGLPAMVLDGGLAKWRAEGRPLSTDFPAPADAPPALAPPGDRIVDADAVARALADGAAQVADARAPDRFRGEAPEPRPGLRAGHMPGARNLPFPRLFAPDGTMLRGDALREAFRAHGIDPDRPVITTCGSGVTAAVLNLGLAVLGKDGHALYDGSWSEWGASDRPIETGPLETG